MRSSQDRILQIVTFSHFYFKMLLTKAKPWNSHKFTIFSKTVKSAINTLPFYSCWTCHVTGGERMGKGKKHPLQHPGRYLCEDVQDRGLYYPKQCMVQCHIAYSVSRYTAYDSWWRQKNVDCLPWLIWHPYSNFADEFIFKHKIPPEQHKNILITFLHLPYKRNLLQPPTHITQCNGLMNWRIWSSQVLILVARMLSPHFQ